MRWKWLPVSFILAAAAFLYSFRLGYQSLWIDELYSVYDAQNATYFPLQIRNTLRPIYYFLLKAWMTLGVSEAWLRALNIPFGLGVVFLTYRLGRHTAGEGVGLAAALMMAFSPRMIDHVQEVRMYALSTFLGLAGTLVLTGIFQRPTVMRMGAWVAARTLVVLVHPINILLLPVDAVLCGLRFFKEKRILILFSGAFWVVGILCAFSIGEMRTVIPHFLNETWVSRLPKPGVVEILKLLTVQWVSLGKVPLHFSIYEGYGALVIGLTGIAIVRQWHNPRLWRIALWFLFPVVAIICISHLTSSIWVPRYLLFIFPYAAILLAAGFMEVWRKWRIAAILITAGYFVMLGAGLHKYYTSAHRQNFRGVFETIHQNEQLDDVLIIHIPHSRPEPVLSYYYKGNAPVHFLPISQDFSPSKAKEQRRGVAVIDWPPLKSRFWIVYQRNPRGITRKTMMRSIRTHFTLLKRQSFWPNIEIFLVEKKHT